MDDVVTEMRLALPGPGGKTRLNVALTGEGPPLLLIHGWCNNWFGWTPLARYLAPHFQLIMPDLPGFGDSDPLPRYDLPGVTALLVRLLDALTLQPVGIVGASLGALLAGDLVSRAPEVASRLVLIGPLLSAAAGRCRLVERLLSPWRDIPLGQRCVAAIIHSRAHAYFMEYFFNARRFQPALIERYGMPGRRKVTGRAYVQLGLAALAFDLDAFIGRTALPTLLLCGAADSHVSGGQIAAYAAQLPHLHAYQLPGAGHNLGYEAPQRSAEIIRDFVCELRV